MQTDVGRDRADRRLHDRVTIGCRGSADEHPRDAACARTVVDDDLLSELIGEPGCNGACGDVGAAAGRYRKNEPYWLARVNLCCVDCDCRETDPQSGARAPAT